MKYLVAIVAISLLIGGGYYLYSASTSNSYEGMVLPVEKAMPEGLNMMEEVENSNSLNSFPETQLREEACAESGLACETNEMRVCRNGKWVCIGPAKGVN